MARLYKLRASLMAALFALCLAGCQEQEDFFLLDDNNNVVGKGMLEITANFPSPAHLILAGKEYAGRWKVGKIYEEELAKSRRLISDRAYMAYEVGNDPEQLKYGQASFSADDGSKIQCDFYFRSQPGKGKCDIGGKQLQLMLKRHSSTDGGMVRE